MFSGIQLLPNNPSKYIQVTNTPDGINLEDWTVYGVDLCDETKFQDITPSFMVDKLTNSLNGDPQLIWSLTNVPVDFGWDLIYLRIEQANGETFYSNPFKLTAIDSEKTSQIFYKYKRTEDYQSIGAQVWFRSKSLQTNVQSYYETSTENTVTTATQTNRTEFYETEMMSIDNLIKIVNVMKLPYVYLDGIRAYFFTAPEIPKPTSQENFGRMEMNLTLNYSDVYTPIQPQNGDFDSNDFDSNDFLIFIP